MFTSKQDRSEELRKQLDLRHRSEKVSRVQSWAEKGGQFDRMPPTPETKASEESMSNQEIPNVVGRMDPVVEALGRGEWDEARKLLVKEVARRDDEIKAETAALDKRLDQAQQLCRFLERIDRREGLDEIRAACLPEDAALDDKDRNHLSDFRVLKTAIEIIQYAVDKNPDSLKTVGIGRQAILSIRNFVEGVRLWHGLGRLKPYRWGGSDRDCKHLIDESYEVKGPPPWWPPSQNSRCVLPEGEGVFVEPLPAEEGGAD